MNITRRAFVSALTLLATAVPALAWFPHGDDYLTGSGSFLIDALGNRLTAR